MNHAALLVLADGRFPAGGHAHSGGAEAAVTAGRVRDVAGLQEFCRGRLHTSGLVAAGLAAAAAAGYAPLLLDEAADARTPVPALRHVARRLGRQLLRAARAGWPSADLDALAVLTRASCSAWPPAPQAWLRWTRRTRRPMRAARPGHRHRPPAESLFVTPQGGQVGGFHRNSRRTVR
ncbi:urease accessory protein UreF [Nonomuraea sp. M3C6]|uniref:Urease accessory protein UreF n=1 Tax=Nonomuraea marmarensis TaxID=3351344 RepID=A0ABW7AST7_9ACTN